ncbi:hypothetical protein VCR14J2_620070 [Vibrio coralliirubri]|uniref:Uncharacterized protein n=1 Tax=Vibrio coralliirubri TaxID=1516159 RepID=A0AA86WPH6_9VIBR|nr:hypothetical protein VCR31J2_1310943 [Vibrio coralliirubri]CDU08418.1 hypothetical protein VCR14J2_620070 [Vibrio coralliirubri]
MPNILIYKLCLHRQIQLTKPSDKVIRNNHLDKPSLSISNSSPAQNSMIYDHIK